MRIAAIGGAPKDSILKSFVRDLDNPNALIIPSACSTESSYDKKVPVCIEMLSTLGLQATVLHDFEEIPTQTKIDHELGSASFAYVLGGNSPHMFKTLELHGTDTAIRSAVIGGLSLAGTSAGAILPFRNAMSCPVGKPAEVEWDYAYLKGLGLIDACLTPHGDQVDPHLTEIDRGNRRDNMLRTLPMGMLGISIENGAALVIDNDRAYVGRARNDASLHIMQHKGDFVDLKEIRDDAELTSSILPLLVS